MAGHTDEHVEEGGIHPAVAETDEKSRAIVGDLAGRKGKHEITHERKHHTLGAIVGEAAIAQGLASGETRHNETARKQGEENAGAIAHMEFLLAIYGDIVAHDTPAEAEQRDVDGKEPSAAQEEVVPVEAGAALTNLAARQPDRETAEIAAEGYGRGEPGRGVGNCRWHYRCRCRPRERWP